MQTATTTAPRYVDGAGHHVKRNVPSKRIKAAHRKYGAGSSLKSFARLARTMSFGGESVAAAKAWLAGKGI